MQIDLIQIGTLSVVILGIASVWLSLDSAREFGKIEGRLPVAIAFTLYGEAFMGAVTTVFAILQLFDLIKILNVEIATLMRISMFVVVAGTTWHLRECRLESSKVE